MAGTAAGDIPVRPFGSIRNQLYLVLLESYCIACAILLTHTADYVNLQALPLSAC